MFILSKYNEKAYEISLGSKLFKAEDDEDISSGSFNVGYFGLYFIKVACNLFNCKLESWRQTQKYVDCC